jgi:homoserine O-succinyltransferase/O-acetyltransferase
MPLLLDTFRSDPAGDLRGRNCLTIGLVNNMPDAACEATERQFQKLLRAASRDVVVRLKLFSVPSVPRSETMRAELATRYRDLSELWNTPLDGLIVTGTEPVAADLKNEPYWNAICDLVDWACHDTISAVWSCLAAHAVVLYVDGIARQRLPGKLSGVFDCDLVGAHPLLGDMAVPLRVPHSRLNDLPEAALVAAGYRLLTRSETAGADAFVKEPDGGSLFVFFQGHLEYDADTLLREYRRDVGRYLRGEMSGYPQAPQKYFNSAASFLADDFRTRAAGDGRSALLGEFPMQGLADGIDNGWHDGAIGIYRNWIDYLKEQKRDRRPSATVERARRVSA